MSDWIPTGAAPDSAVVRSLLVGARRELRNAGRGRVDADPAARRAWAAMSPAQRRALWDDLEMDPEEWRR